MKVLLGLFVLVCLQAAFAQQCSEPSKTVTITATDATQGVSFPTQNINRGDTVVWINQRTTTIVVISTENPALFESPPLGTGQQYSRRFDQAGAYSYWLLFELNSISVVNVVQCEPFTTTASPSPSQVFSRTPSTTVTAARSVSPTPSISISNSPIPEIPSPSPSPIDFCTGLPTNEVHLAPGGGVPVMDNLTIPVDAVLSRAFMPLQTEDVRITVRSSGSIDFSVSSQQGEPFSNPLCSWSTTNCEFSVQVFTLRCRTTYVATVNDNLPPRVTWYANVRNRLGRTVWADVRFLNVLREQKNPLVTSITLENSAGSQSVPLLA